MAINVRLVPKDEEVADALPAPLFDDVPVLIREHGRARGFERLRDIVLENPLGLGADNLLPVLKMVIELDRHALFAQVSEAKARERGDQDAWEKFQAYLHGEDATEAEPAKKPKKERKRGKPQKAERPALREDHSILGLLRGSDHPGPEGPGEHDPAGRGARA